jgi:hypothetical protein
MLQKRPQVLLYSPVTDTFLEDMTKNADRVFYFDEGQGKRYQSTVAEILMSFGGD